MSGTRPKSSSTRKSELTHSKNMMDDILKDTLRDPRMYKLYDEMKNE